MLYERRAVTFSLGAVGIGQFRPGRPAAAAELPIRDFGDAPSAL
jgi:hypothetical protein